MKTLKNLTLIGIAVLSLVNIAPAIAEPILVEGGDRDYVNYIKPETLRLQGNGAFLTAVVLKRNPKGALKHFITIESYYDCKAKTRESYKAYSLTTGWIKIDWQDKSKVEEDTVAGNILSYACRRAGFGDVYATN